MTSLSEPALRPEAGQEHGDERQAALVRCILLGELTVEQICEQEGISHDELKHWMRVHRRSVRRAIDEQIAGALSDQGLEKEDFVLSGNLESLVLSDLLQTIQLGRKNAHIRIEHGGEYSHLWCADGDVIDATSGQLLGSPAVYRTLALEQGRLEAEFSSVLRERTIMASTEELLVEFARRLDESKVLRARLGDTERVLVRNPAAGSLELDARQREILQAFDGNRSVHAVITASKSPELETLATITRLIESQQLVTPPSQSAPVAQPRPVSGTGTAVPLAAQPGYASTFPTNAGRASQVSVPAIAPSLVAERAKLPAGRRYGPFAIAGVSLLVAFALGLWAARRPALQPEHVSPASQPFVAGLTAALCGPGMTLFTPGAAAPAGSAGADLSLRPFCLARDPVSSREYQACVDSQQCEPAQIEQGAVREEPGASAAPRCNAGQSGREQLPINCITQRQADRYCEWRGQRLPLPLEWRLAWRWNHGTAGAAAEGSAVSAGPESPLIHIGEISEWTKDYGVPQQRGAAPNAEQPLYAIQQVGSAAGSVPSETPANRLHMNVSAHGRGIGFRCALSLTATALALERNVR